MISFHSSNVEVTCCTGNCDENVREHESVAAPGNNEIVIQQVFVVVILLCELVFACVIIWL